MSVGREFQAVGPETVLGLPSLPSSSEVASLSVIGHLGLDYMLVLSFYVKSCIFEHINRQNFSGDRDRPCYKTAALSGHEVEVTVWTDWLYVDVVRSEPLRVCSR